MEPTKAKSRYVEAFERNTKGMEFLSTGICPGCDECRSDYDAYTVRELDTHNDSVDDTVTDSPIEWGYSADPEKRFPTEELAEAASREAFDDDISNGHICSEGGFSWSACDLCGSSLGGDREAYHWDDHGELRHGYGACVDCIMYIANGDEPDDWRRSSLDDGGEWCVVCTNVTPDLAVGGTCDECKAAQTEDTTDAK